MKSFLILAFLPVSFYSQRVEEQSGNSDLLVEWKKEFNLPPQSMTGITGLFRLGEHWYCSPSNLAETRMQSITNGSYPADAFTIPNYVWWYAIEEGKLWSREGRSLIQRDPITGSAIKTLTYMVQEDWPGTSPVSCYYKGSLYYAEYSIICRFDDQGNLVWKKQVSNYADEPAIMCQGNGNIYLFGRYKESGSRLMKYDTLGNQKWSVGIGRFVYGMYADNEGNCYMLTAEGGGVGYVEMYDKEGNLAKDIKLPGQCGKNAFRLGDSLFVCGQVSSPERVDGQKLAAFCIISASTGKIYYQQSENLDPDPQNNEDFTQIVSDGQNVYVGGVYGGEVKQNVLVKYSKTGTTGLNEPTGSRSFSVYPNPGSGKYTISCTANNSGTLKVTVRNGLGQIVQRKEIPCEGQSSWELDLGKQPAGHYSIEIGSGKDKVVKKIVVE